MRYPGEGADWRGVGGVYILRKVFKRNRLSPNSRRGTDTGHTGRRKRLRPDRSVAVRSVVAVLLCRTQSYAARRHSQHTGASDASAPLTGKDAGLRGAEV